MNAEDLRALILDASVSDDRVYHALIEFIATEEDMSDNALEEFAALGDLLLEHRPAVRERLMERVVEDHEACQGIEEKEGDDGPA